MRRSKYLKKKFEYYEKMHEISREAQDFRRKEHTYLMERLKLEIVLLESNVRKKLVSEIVDHFTSETTKQDVIAEIRERVLEEVKEELKEDKEDVQKGDTPG